MNISEMQEQFGKALAARKANKINTAIGILDDLLLKEPKFIAGWNQRGEILDSVGNYFDAMLNFNQAMLLAPNEAIPYNNRGTSYLNLSRFDDALADFGAAIERDPNMPQVWNNKANTYRRMVRIKEAADCYRKATQLDPNYTDAHLGLGMSLLELQQFEEGWHEFEWRFKSDQMPPRKLKAPRWGGQPAKLGEALLVWGEQGFGDILQFVRYVQLAKERWAGPIYVEVRLPLARLVSTVDGVDGVVVLGEGIPVNVAYQLPMMSLPAIVGTEKGFMGPYLKADENIKKNWVPLLSQLPDGLRVGLCWAGMNREENATASAIDARRSLSLSSLAPALRTKGVVWFSLQKGGPAEQAKAPPPGVAIADLMPETQDFADTAALISHLDLVITVDTAVAHLAGGLGTPTWMLSRFDGCWRWFGDRPDTPWYPCMTQFRQKTENDWAPVVEDVWRNLQRFVASKRLVA